MTGPGAPEARKAGTLLGAVLAGGRSRRFGGGSPKHEAEVADVRMIDRAIEALRPHTARVVGVVTADADPDGFPVPVRPDATPGIGPLEGLRVALEWAAEDGHVGVAVLPCDLPLVDADVVGRLVRAFRALPAGPPALVTSAGGRVHPLAGVYGVGARQAVERRIREGRRSVHGLVDELGVDPVPAEELGVAPERFLNVNRRDDLERARVLAARLAAVKGRDEARARDLPPVLCVVGWKDSGKTTLVVRLVEELVRRGRNVMTAKHGHGFDLDRPGTDSFRHRHEAGASRVALVGPEEVAVMGGWGPDGELPLDEVVRRYLRDAEIVVAEGWKRGPEPKIEVHRSEGRTPILLDDPPNPETFLALVTDRTDLSLPLPVFDLDAPDLVERLTDWIEGTFLDPVPEGAGARDT